MSTITFVTKTEIKYLKQEEEIYYLQGYFVSDSFVFTHDKEHWILSDRNRPRVNLWKTLFIVALITAWIVYSYFEAINENFIFSVKEYQSGNKVYNTNMVTKQKCCNKRSHNNTLCLLEDWKKRIIRDSYSLCKLYIFNTLVCLKTGTPF